MARPVVMAGSLPCYPLPPPERAPKRPWRSRIFRPMPYIITENCTGCTACMKRCPTDAITGDRKLLHVIDPELCIDCGACGPVCPDEAIYDHEGTLCEMLKASARPIAFVDLQSCVGCEWCVWASPFDALVMAKTPGAGPHHKRAAWPISLPLQQ